MVEFSDLFDSEVDEFQKKAKSEEEIQKMCTKENLTEVQRAIHLLKKGYEMQKISVISGLNRFMREGGANEDLLSLILSSLDDWDDKMQIECAKAFVPALKEGNVNVNNKQRILNLAVQITTNEYCENLALLDEWLAVFETVVGMVPFDYAHMVALKPIQETLDRKNPMVRRKRGNRLLTSMALAWGETAFTEEKAILRHIIGICGDTNYEIRLDGANFLKTFLTEKGAELAGTARLDDDLLPELYELLHDEEAHVRITAIEASIELLEVLDPADIEREIIPPLLRLMQGSPQEDIEQLLAKISGRFLYRLTKSGLHLKYKDKIQEYYQRICEHENDVVRLNAAYNLPCFQTVYNTRSAPKKQLPKPETATTQTTRDTAVSQEETKDSGNEEEEMEENFDFAGQYATFAGDPNVELRTMVAACLHEAFLMAGAWLDTAPLKEAFHTLLADDDTAVLTAMAQKLDQIVLNYVNRRELQSTGPSELQHLQTTPLAGGVTTPSHNLNGKSILDLPKKHEGPQFRGSSRSFNFKKTMTMGNPDLDRLQDGDDCGVNYLVLPEHQHESVYSALMTRLLAFKTVTKEKISMWREHCLWVEHFNKSIERFHLPEVHDRLAPLLFEDIQRGNTQMRRACAECLVLILMNQQDSIRRSALAQQVRSDLGESTAFQMRKTFVFVCRYAVGRLPIAFFEEHFCETFVSLCDDKVPHVRMEFAKALVDVRPYLEPSPKVSMELSERCDKLKNDNDRDVADASEATDMHLLLNRKKILRELQEKEITCQQRMDLLAKREAREIEERKKRAEEDDDLNYNYGSYSHSNRTGALGSKKPVKQTGKLRPVAGKTTGASKQSSSGSGISDKTPTKRKTAVGKRQVDSLSGANRNSSALPSNQDLGVEKGAGGGTRKTSVLLPSSASGLDSKNPALQIPGMREYNRDNGSDNYKRYQQPSSGAQPSGTVNGYKRSHSLLAEQQAATGGKTRVTRRSHLGAESSHTVTSVSGMQTATNKKNGYQKLKNPAVKGALSSSDSSDDDLTPQSRGSRSSKTGTGPSFRTKY